MPLKIQPFNLNHLAEAAKLVCQRYTQLCQENPTLPQPYQQEQVMLEILTKLNKDAQGVSALEGNRLVGFMLGVQINEFMGRRAAYSPDYANAAQGERASDIYETMYTECAKEWVSAGCCTHAISVLVNNHPALQALHWQGFGLINVDAVRDLQPLPQGAEGVLVRQATPSDSDTIQAFNHALEHHESAAPIYWLHELENYSAKLDQPGYSAWLAYAGKQAVGSLVLLPGDETECLFMRDPQTTYLYSAFIAEPVRGKGIASALLNHAFDWARQAGYARCAVDFESTNTSAHRFWMKHYKPVSYSFVRVLDGRIK